MSMSESDEGGGGDRGEEREGGNPDSTDRKKQTHLRCERQRREAINSGYAELKQLLPSTLAPLGCKTTNASILYRACDYIRQLQTELAQCDDETRKQKQQAMALQIISSQYEQLSLEQEQVIGPGGQPISTGLSGIKLHMFLNLMDEWFKSFDEEVSTEDYATLTRTFLSWLERVDFQKSADCLDCGQFQK